MISCSGSHSNKFQSMIFKELELKELLVEVKKLRMSEDFSGVLVRNEFIEHGLNPDFVQLNIPFPGKRNIRACISG